MRKLKIFCIILIILISISVTNWAILLGDIDLDGEITINDLARLKLHLLGLLDIEENKIENIDIGREKLKIKDRKIVSASSGVEFKMKGMAVVNVFNGNNFNKEEDIITSFKLLKDEGFNTIRYQLPSTMFYDYDTDTWNEENIEKLKNMCQIAEETGIYVIVDMHTLKPSQVGFYDRTNHTYCMVSDKESEYTPGFIKIWTRLGKELVGYNSILAYELMNEPHAMWETSQEMALENYRKIIQGCIDGIRENDKDTIISFQRIFNYIDTSYNWTTPTVSCWPDIEGDNFLIDSYHSYDNMVFNADMVYSNIAYGATQEYGTWHAEEYANIENSNYNTYSITIKAGDTAELLSSSAIRLENGVGTIVTTDNYKVYRINEDGTETEIISFSSTDDINKQNVYKYADTLGKEKEVNGKKYDFDLIHFLKLGLEPNEQIRISVDIKFENYSENTRMRWEYTTYKILPNEKGQDLVRGYEKLENTIIEYDEISKRYNSPIYWGEFCIKNQYINQYGDYIAYIDAFVELAEKYNLNWMWHHMSEYPADNGYGAYSKGDLPYPENKRPEMWNYIFPKLLALTQ